jgi:hypothetical protein
MPSSPGRREGGRRREENRKGGRREEERKRESSVDKQIGRDRRRERERERERGRKGGRKGGREGGREERKGTAGRGIGEIKEADQDGELCNSNAQTQKHKCATRARVPESLKRDNGINALALDSRSLQAGMCACMNAKSGTRKATQRSENQHVATQHSGLDGLFQPAPMCPLRRLPSAHSALRG